MKFKPLTAGVILISGILLAAFAQQPTGEYLGEEPPAITPKIFSPNFISNRNVVGGTFSPDKREFYFSRFTANSLRIYFTRNSKSGWTEPKEAEFNKGHFGGPPFFSPDGSQLIWRAARPFPDDWPGLKPKPGSLEEVAYWSMIRTESGWSAPRPMELPVPKDMRQHGVSVTREGTVFISYGNNVARIPLKNDSYSDPEIILTGYSGAYPAVAPDESFLVLTKQGLPRRLLVSFKKEDNTWTMPKDLGGQVNHPAMNGYPYISPDGKYLFYTAGHRIYWVSTDIIHSLKKD